MYTSQFIKTTGMIFRKPHFVYVEGLIIIADIYLLHFLYFSTFSPFAIWVVLFLADKWYMQWFLLGTNSDVWVNSTIRWMISNVGMLTPYDLLNRITPVNYMFSLSFCHWSGKRLLCFCIYVIYVLFILQWTFCGVKFMKVLANIFEGTAPGRRFNILLLQVFNNFQAFKMIM